jgi:RHS repeat-associated protein
LQTTYNQPNVSLTYANVGLDRYGRIINHSWIEDNQPLVHIIHGYDYAGNRNHCYDAVHAALSELYSYDAVNQIKSLQRGELDNNFETITNLTFSESWNFDKTGNWLEYGKNGTTQTQTANTASQILSINGNTTSLAHDANGNMLKTPKPDENGNHFIFKYDAWNRVTAVYESDGSTKIAEYFYNGLGHRITKKTYVGGILTETRNYFYNEKWQCIEERVGATIDRTYVWGTRGIDDIVMRERGEERLYPLTDPNNNIVAIIDSTGEVKERYHYDAFGKVTYLNPDFSVRITSQYDWDFLFTSRRLDNETGLMYYRNRYYHPIIGRFTSIDPLGYDAGDVNLYRYVNNQPETLVDPMGLDAFIGDCFRMDPPPPEPFTQEELRQMVSEGIYNNISNTLTGIGQTAGGIWSVVGSTVISVGITAGENSGYISPIVGKAWWVLDFVVNPNTIGDAESRNTIPWSPELPPTLPRPVTEEPFTEEPDIEEPDWIWTDDGHCNGGQFCPNPKKSF